MECPLRFAPNAETLTGPTTICLETECPWWHTPNATCSIQVIANALAIIAGNVAAKAQGGVQRVQVVPPTNPRG